MRVELFDDEIDNIATFDPLTGEVLDAGTPLHGLPEDPLRDPQGTHPRRCSTRFKRRTAPNAWRVLKEHNKLVEAQRLEQRTRFDLEMIKPNWATARGIENYSRYLSGRRARRAAADVVRLPARRMPC